MNYKPYQPNPRIVERAAALWVAMLTDPKYDNGDDSPNGLAACGLVQIVPRNNTPEVLARFGEELTKILLAPLKWKSESNGEEFETLFDCLHVDYGPDIPLREAAKRAGLRMEFPWKTSMYLYEDYLYVRYGYSATPLYHYPLSGDRWLVTSLCGADMPKIIALVETGVVGPDLQRALMPDPPANATAVETLREWLAESERGHAAILRGMDNEKEEWIREGAKLALPRSQAHIEALRAGIAALERLETAKQHVSNIDIYLNVPPGVMASNPFICTGASLGECLEKIGREMAAATAPKGDA